MPTPKLTSIQVRRGTKSEWDLANPQLLDGEIGLETNTYRMKVGHRNENGELTYWNDLRYQAPFSGLEKPVYPQDGDFWIQENSKQIYFFDGEVWRALLSTNSDGDVIIDGNLNLENGCITGDLKPCADVKFKLGTSDKRWNELHMGDSISPVDFKITVGQTTDPYATPGNYRLQLNGDDIAIRDDFANIDTRDLKLWRQTDANGNLAPVPREYEEYVNMNARNLPPTPGFNSQSQVNSWTVSSIRLIAGSSEEPGAQYMEFWNDSSFALPLEAQRGVNTPVDGNETDYDNATTQSTYFHKADGSLSDRVPLNQSYWTDVPRLLV